MEEDPKLYVRVRRVQERKVAAESHAAAFARLQQNVSATGILARFPTRSVREGDLTHVGAGPSE